MGFETSSQSLEFVSVGQNIWIMGNKMAFVDTTQWNKPLLSFSKTWRRGLYHFNKEKSAIPSSNKVQHYDIVISIIFLYVQFSILMLQYSTEIFVLILSTLIFLSSVIRIFEYPNYTWSQLVRINDVPLYLPRPMVILFQVKYMDQD